LSGTSCDASFIKAVFYPSVKPRDSFLVLALVLVTPGATALTLTPKNDVSRAAHFTSMLSIAIDVE